MDFRLHSTIRITEGIGTFKGCNMREWELVAIAHLRDESSALRPQQRSLMSSKLGMKAAWRNVDVVCGFVQIYNI